MSVSPRVKPELDDAHLSHASYPTSSPPVLLAPKPEMSSQSLSDISPKSDTLTAQPASADQGDGGHHCMWDGCSHVAIDPEVLYIHLCNDHIGRKSTGNLCLTCRWKDCGVSCAKRDHITSHLRVHTPLKPHNCEVRLCCLFVCCLIVGADTAMRPDLR